MDHIEQLALQLHDIDAVKLGRFQLSSGKRSPIYIDLRVLMSHPAVLRQAAIAYSSILDSLEYDLLGAIPYGGLPLGVAIALERDQPLVFPRKASKSYGTGKTIEGKFTVGQTVVIIEDIVTTGESALGGVAMLKSAGLRIADIVVLLDREQGADENIAARGYRLHSVMNMHQLLGALEEHDRITNRQRRAVLDELG